MKNLKLFGVVLLLVIGSFTFTGCSLVSVNADEEGVYVMKPYIFGSGGVSPEPLIEGSEYVAVSTEIIRYKNIPVQYVEGFNDVITVDNNLIDLNVYLVLQIEKGKSPILHDEFGEHWYENNIKENFRKTLRDRLSAYDMPTLTTNREIYAKINQDINNHVKQIIVEKKMPVIVVDVMVGRATPNKGALEEIDRTSAQIQAKQTQIKRGEMEDARKTAEKKRATADKAYMEELGLSTSEFIHLRSLEIQKEQIEMVKAKSNVNIDIIMDNSNAQPMYQLRKD